MFGCMSYYVSSHGTIKFIHSFTWVNSVILLVAMQLSPEQCKIRGKLIAFTGRKLHMLCQLYKSC